MFGEREFRAYNVGEQSKRDISIMYLFSICDSTSLNLTILTISLLLHLFMEVL
jgi:hypothetical protein